MKLKPSEKYSSVRAAQWTTSLVTLACVLTESFSGFGIGLNVLSPARMKKRVP